MATEGGPGSPTPHAAAVGGAAPAHEDAAGVRPGTLVPWSRWAVPGGPGAERTSAFRTPRLALVSVPSGLGCGVCPPEAPRRVACAGVRPRPTERSGGAILGVVHGPLCRTWRGVPSRLRWRLCKRGRCGGTVGEELPVTLAVETSGREETGSAPCLGNQRRQWQTEEAGSSLSGSELSPGEVRDGPAWALKETMVPVRAPGPRTVGTWTT